MKETKEIKETNKTNTKKPNKTKASSSSSSSFTPNCFDEVIAHMSSKSSSSQKSHNSSKSTTKKPNSAIPTPPIDFTEYANNYVKSMDNLTQEQLMELLQPTESTIELLSSFGLNPLKNMFTSLSFIEETKDINSIPAFELPHEFLGNLIEDLYLTSSESILDSYFNSNPIYVHFYDGSEAIFYISAEFEGYIGILNSTKTYKEKIDCIFDKIRGDGLPIDNEFKCSDCVDKENGLYFAGYDAMMNPEKYGLIIETEPNIFIPII